MLGYGPRRSRRRFRAAAGGGAPDTTAPTITSANPSGSYAEGVAIGGTLTADEAVTWSKSGADAARVTLDPATGAWSLEATDFAIRASYAWSFAATDFAGNASAPQAVGIAISDVEEGDWTAPVLSSPTATATGTSTATLSVVTDEDNGTLYWAVTTSATPPDESALMTGTGAADFGSQEVLAAGTQNATASDLAAATGHYVHFLHRDAAANGSEIVTSAVFTTQAAPALALTLTPGSASMAEDAAEGSQVFAIGNVPTGVTPTLTPNDGRFVIAGSEGSGWTVRRGLSAVTPGTVSLTIAATGATSASGDVTITAVVVDTGIAFEPWMLFYNTDGSRIATGTTNRLAPGGFYTVSDPASLRNVAGSQASVGDYVQTIQDRSIAPGDVATTPNHLIASTTGGTAASADANRGQLISTNQRGGFNTVRLDNTGSTLSRRYDQQTGGAHTVMHRVFSRYVRPPATAAIKVALGDSSGNFSAVLSTSDATVRGRTSLGNTTGASGNLETVTDAGWRRHAIRKQHSGNTFFGKISASEADTVSGGAFSISGGRAAVGNYWGSGAGEDCDFACFLDFPITLSRWHEQMFEGWEAHTFGWAADLPAEHPFKAAAPKVPAGTVGVADVVGFNLAASTRRQVWLGSISEVENDSHDPSVQSNPHAFNPSPNWGALRDLLPSGLRASTTLSEGDIDGTQFKTLRDRIFKPGAGRYVQMRLGNQIYRGFQQTDATSGLGKMWGQRFTGQDAQYKRFFANLAGVVLCESTSEPYWKNNDVAPFGTLRGRLDRTTDAKFTASVSGTTLTVTAMTQGTILIGHTLSAPATTMPTITAQTSGTTGGVGVYTLSASTAASPAGTAMIANHTLDQLRALDATAYNATLTALAANKIALWEWWHQNMTPVLGYEHNEMTNGGDYFGTCFFTDELTRDYFTALIAAFDASAVFTSSEKSNFTFLIDGHFGPGTAVRASAMWADPRVDASIHRIFGAGMGSHEGNQDLAKSGFSTVIAPYLKAGLQNGVNNTEFEQSDAAALDTEAEQRAWCAGTILNRLNYKTLCRARVHSSILHWLKHPQSGEAGSSNPGNQSSTGYAAYIYTRAEAGSDPTGGSPARGTFQAQPWNLNGYLMDLDEIPSRSRVLEVNVPGQLYGQSGIAQLDAYAVSNGTGKQLTASLDDDGNVYWELANQTASAWTVTLWLGGNRTTRFRRYNLDEIGGGEATATGHFRTVTVPAYSGAVVTQQ